MSNTIKISLIVVSFICFSCVSIIDLEHPPFTEKVVLTGILNPDSIINIRLSKSFKLDKPFDPISDAITDGVVKVFEDGNYLGTMNHSQLGNYTLPVKPKRGKAYSIQANTFLGTINAVDSISVTPPLTISVTPPQSHNPNSNPDFLITISKNNISNGNYWIAICETKNGSEHGQGWFSLVSGSPYLDTFNASNDQFYIVKNYGYLARMLPVQDSVVLRISTFNQLAPLFLNGGSLLVRVIHASLAYDSFLKSSVTAADTKFMNLNGSLNNPFYEPTIVSSNINGGLGIFGAVNITDFHVHQLPY